MKGLGGPFHFVVPTEGEAIAWNKLDTKIVKKLKERHGLGAHNSRVYLCVISVSRHERLTERHHDWSKVTRVFVNAKPLHKNITILGLYPGDTKAEHIDQSELEFARGAEASSSLFTSLPFKLTISQKVKKLSTSERYAILTTYDKSYAQLVYSEAWHRLAFEIYLYIAVPNTLENDLRYIDLGITPVRKRNISISTAAIHNHYVFLP